MPRPLLFLHHGYTCYEENSAGGDSRLMPGGQITHTQSHEEIQSDEFLPTARTSFLYRKL